MLAGEARAGAVGEAIAESAEPTVEGQGGFVVVAFEIEKEIVAAINQPGEGDVAQVNLGQPIPLELRATGQGRLGVEP